MPAKKRTLSFVGRAKEELRSFPADPRRDAGHQLWRLEQGLEPDHWKSISTVGPGVREIIITDAQEHRVFYVTTSGDSTYVLHAFEKKTQQTAKHNIETGRKRLQQLNRELRAAKKRKAKTR